MKQEGDTIVLLSEGVSQSINKVLEGSHFIQKLAGHVGPRSGHTREGAECEGSWGEGRWGGRPESFLGKKSPQRR